MAIKNNANKQWLVILNPHAGGKKGEKDKGKIMKLLKKSGLDFSIVTSDYPGHAVAITRESITNGFRNFIGAGGDGTLNEIVNGIFQQQEVSSDEFTLGMIPVGTGNDWIRTFGIPTGYEEAIRVISNGNYVCQDIGKICKTEGDVETTRYFANMTGYGFDAMVADRVNILKNEGATGLRLYIQSLLVSLFRYKTGRVKITIDNKEINEWIFSVSIGIGKFNGGGMMQVPGADPLSGNFHVTLIRKIGFFSILINIPGLFNGSFVKDKHVSTYIAREISIHSGSILPGEADGETLGKGNFRISLLPSAIKVICGIEFYRKAREKQKQPENKLVSVS
ncbi:MAG: diacylglycerol/lipid kinase family protein [Bacteroidota bacterium]